MLRTPTKTKGGIRFEVDGRPAKAKAKGRITEILQQGKRTERVFSQLMDGETTANHQNDSQLRASRSFNVNFPISVPLHGPLPGVSGLNQVHHSNNSHVASQANEQHGNNDQPTNPAQLDDNRSIFSHRTRISTASNVSRTQSQLAVIEKTQQVRERTFLQIQRQNEELLDFEMHMMERKRQEMLKQNQERERFMKEQEKLEERRIQLQNELENELITEDQQQAEPRESVVNEWLKQHQVYQPSQQIPNEFGRSIPVTTQQMKDAFIEDVPVVPVRVQRTAAPFQTQQMQNEFVQNIPVAPARLQRTASAPISYVNSQRDEVLATAFKALQTRQIKDLPTFNGDNILEWPYFYTEFVRTTEEFQCSESENLRRLQKALQGKAKATVIPLLSNPNNVNRIIRMLKINFGRTEWVMSKITHQLQHLQPVAEADVEGMRTLYNQVFGLFYATESVGGEAYIQSPQVINSLAEKLPPFSRNEWNRYRANLLRENIIVSFDCFLLWLEKELDTTFASFNPTPIKVKRFPERSKNVMTHRIDPRTQALTKCILCNSKDHSHLWNCDKFRRLNIKERRATARDLRICFNCLERGHGSKQCKKENKCTSCGAKHNKLLHLDSDPAQFVNFEYSNEDDSEDDLNDETVEANVTEDLIDFQQQLHPVDEKENKEISDIFVNFKTSNVLLRVGKVQVYGPDKIMTVVALFDEGSQSTMIDESLAKQLQLNGNISPVTYRWTGKMVKHHPNSRKVELQISGPSVGSKKYALRQVRTIENLALPEQKFDMNLITQLYPNIDVDKLYAIQGCTPKLLIGSDHANLIVPRKTLSYHEDGLQLTRCLLGWTIHGLIEPKITSEVLSLNVCITTNKKEDESLEKLVAQQFKIEQFGITNASPVMSKDDKRAVEIMERTLKKVGNRYEIGLPYRYDNIKFPESKSAALRRLLLIERKMDQDDKFAAGYCAKIQDYIDKGYARKLNPNEAVESNKTMYHSHFGVYNIHKPGKVRLVMDLKAKLQGVSFNDLLLKGPDFVPDLISVLWRGRLQKVGFVADICEMFHQVEIRKEDRCSQRFLFRGMRRIGDPDVYEMNRMMFGAVSSPSQAQFVKNRNAELLEATYPGIERAIRKQHYVDDYVDCADSVLEAVERINSVVTAHDQGGFKLVKFVSNSPEVINAIREELRDEPKEDQIERVLGLLWDTKTDDYIVSLNIPTLIKYAEKEKPLTKRELLRALMSVFDPLGMVQPIMIKLKIIFQNLWRKKMEWDDPISLEIQNRWSQWVKETLTIETVRLPRAYFPKMNKISSADLHVFCDASDKAYSTVAYLVINDGENHYASFIQSKSKVAPIKHLTIPRMELQACVLGSELASNIVHEIGIPIVDQHFWTDSTITLNWFSTNEKLNAFVGARVTKIFEKEDITVSNWHWIPSATNVADLATKEQKVDLKQWLQGPEFLKMDKSEWPKFEAPPLSKEELTFFHQETIDQMFVCFVEEVQNILLPNIDRFSKFNRLIRATAYVIKMSTALCNKFKKSDRPSKKELFTLSVEDLEHAKQLWYRKVQLEVYSEEIMDLNGQGYVKQRSPLFTHSPFLHNGILRVKGRIQDSQLTFEENNPVILPGKHKFTCLLIDLYHQNNNHSGTGTVMNNLRQLYDIIGVKVQVRKIFAKCVTCKKLRAKPRIPMMGNLPKERTTPYVHAFQHAGLDYLGPFLITVGRRHEKRWIALFTDMVTRACHTEIVHSLSTDSAIKAVQRFANQRGVPESITSDNATCFRGADNELKEFYQNLQNDIDIINEKLSLQNIKWKFIPPGAPHFGGVYERKVQSIKKGLTVALNELYPNDETFATAISNVVNTINNTPIGEISNDPSEPRALCPNDILIGRSNNTAMNVTTTNLKIDRSSWKASQAIADRFWSRWVKECRPLLQHRSKWYDNHNYLQFQVDDVVIIADENLKRNVWPLGVIIQTHPGKDTKVRTVTVRTNSGEFKRPVAKIILIHRPSAGVENVEQNKNE